MAARKVNDALIWCHACWGTVGDCPYCHGEWRLSDPTIEDLNATIELYPDPDDKLNIALGNFNRVRAERDALADALLPFTFFDFHATPWIPFSDADGRELRGVPAKEIDGLIELVENARTALNQRKRGSDG